MSIKVNTLFSLQDKVAIVTGALGLLGKQHCLALAEAGASVVVTDINHEKCVEFANELSKSYAPSLGFGANITSKDSIEKLRDAALSQFGHIDILVNNAAINDMFENPTAAADLSKFENYPLDLWQKSIDVNVTGVFICAQIIGTQMAKQGKGSIINVASTYGIVAPDQSIYKKPDGSQTFWKSIAYPATKGAVISMTRFLATYWGEKGVRANSLSPGGVENSQDEYFLKNYSAKTPLGRMAENTDYKGAIVFLASDASSYMTGSNLVVDGGWTAW
ncbi:MAG: SDR family oxidoreductase [Chloroherpetonaceae bacterium]|nr:SDR family oxidoreductase [Chloroherpetonaceae bacterium]